MSIILCVLELKGYNNNYIIYNYNLNYYFKLLI